MARVEPNGFPESNDPFRPMPPIDWMDGRVWRLRIADFDNWLGKHPSKGSLYLDEAYTLTRQRERARALLHEAARDRGGHGKARTVRSSEDLWWQYHDIPRSECTECSPHRNRRSSGRKEA